MCVCVYDRPTDYGEEGGRGELQPMKAYRQCLGKYRALLPVGIHARRRLVKKDHA